MPSYTRATSSRRTGLPFRYATIIGAYCAAFMSWLLARTVSVRSGANIVPVGVLSLPLAMAVASSSRPRLWAASCRGSASMRTAYLAAPYTWTCATPATIEMRWAMVDSAYSSTVQIGSVGERSASSTTG